MNDEGKYPSWRDALFSDDTIANLRCVVKYVFWHAAYVLLFLLGALFVLGSRLVDSIFGSRVTKKTLDLLQSDTAKAVSRIGVKILAFAVVFAAGFGVVYTTYTYPWQTLKVIGIAILWCIFLVVFIGVIMLVAELVKKLFGGAFDKTKERFQGTGKKLSETPGVRRIYGNCPVDFNMEPKWADNLLDRLE